MSSARENTNGSRGTTGLPPVPSIPLTAETAAGLAEEASVGGLVRDATVHLSTLVRAEVELAKSEIKVEVRKALAGSLFLIIALTVFLISLLFPLMALGYMAHDVWEWPLSLSFLLAFGIMLLFVFGLGFLGYRKMRKIRAPQRTIDSAKDTVAALTRRGEDR